MVNTHPKVDKAVKIQITESNQPPSSSQDTTENKVDMKSEGEPLANFTQRGRNLCSSFATNRESYDDSGHSL